MTFYETVRAKASKALREFLMDAPADAYVDAAVSKLGLPDDKVLTPRELVELDRIMQDEMLADGFLNAAWLRLPMQGDK